MDNPDSLPDGVVPLIDLRRFADAVAKGEQGFARGVRGPAPLSEPKAAEGRHVSRREALAIAWLKFYLIEARRFPDKPIRARVKLSADEYAAPLHGIERKLLELARIHKIPKASCSPWMWDAPLTAIYVASALHRLNSLKRWLRWASDSRQRRARVVAVATSRRSFQLAAEIGQLVEGLPDWTAADRMRAAHAARHGPYPDRRKMRRTWEEELTAGGLSKHGADELTGRRFGLSGRRVREIRLKEKWGT